MPSLISAHGALASLMLCLLVLIEEAGLPLPLVPGDLLLVTAGVLIAAHTVNPWLFAPAVALAAASGAMVAFLWSRAVGLRRIGSVAARLHALGLLERATRRLRTSGSRGILVARLVPGLRVYSSFAAGLSEMAPGVFLRGLLPAVALWVAAMLSAGAVVGAPATRLMSRAQQAGAEGALLALLATVAYVTLRHLPAAGRVESPAPRRGVRRVAAGLAVDLSVIIVGAYGMGELVGSVLGSAQSTPVAHLVIGAAVLVLYVAAARRSSGTTAGEALFGITYLRAAAGTPPLQHVTTRVTR